MASAHRTPNRVAGQADLLVRGRVLTLASAAPRTFALAVRAGRVVALGQPALARCGAATRLLDCGDRTVLPAFVDAHLHLVGLASALLSADCSGARSIAEIQTIVAQAATRLPPGAWVRASSYSEDRLAERRHPTRWELDAAAPGHPVRLRHATRHASVLSSRALALAGIGRDTPDPPGGHVGRDAAGEPNGLLVDLDAWPSTTVVPRRDATEIAAGVAAAGQRLLAAGVTSVHDLTATNTLATFEDLRGWQQQGHLGVRVTLFTGVETLDERRAAGAWPGRGDAWLAWGGLKLLLGQAGGQVAPSPPAVAALVRDAQRAGFPVALHAVEAEEVLAAAEACAQAQGAGDLPWPHRVEHAAVCPPGFAERIAAAGAAIVTQPAFVYWRGDRYRAAYPRAAWRWLYAARSLLHAGVALAAGSDAPVVPPEPLVALRAALTRRTEEGYVLGASERLGLDATLPLFTRSAAALGGQADRGHLGPGAHADLVVLDGRLADLAHAERPLPRVWLTLCGGQVAYAAPDAAALLVASDWGEQPKPPSIDQPLQPRL
ncbi:MAG: amidohydrolase family protein [Chloroflexi bacterium]|nr:amidohydrolase family protein [Chloroflexota bacterium]